MMKRLFAIVTVALGLMLLVMPAAAQENTPNFPANTITVTGTGTAFGSPDIATLEIGVETASPDVAMAFNEVNSRIDTVIAALTEAGVAREDIRTVNLSIFQEFNGGMPLPMDPASSGMAQESQQNYRVSNMVRVTVRDTSTVADVINAAVTNGANQIFGLNFGIDNRDALESEARADAMADARARAEELATLAGVELGDVVVVSEGFGGFNAFNGVMNSFDSAMMPMGGGGASIEPGQLSVGIQLQVTFAINR